MSTRGRGRGSERTVTITTINDRFSQVRGSSRGFAAEGRGNRRVATQSRGKDNRSQAVAQRRSGSQQVNGNSYNGVQKANRARGGRGGARGGIRGGTRGGMRGRGARGTRGRGMRGRGGRGRGGKPTAEALDKELDAYMEKDSKIMQSRLDDDLEQYMKGREEAE